MTGLPILLCAWMLGCVALAVVAVSLRDERDRVLRIIVAGLGVYGTLWGLAKILGMGAMQ